MPGLDRVRPQGDASSPAEIDSLRAELLAARQRLEELERERAVSAEREMLLRNEVQHRVRNMLAIIRSIFSRTVETDPLIEDRGDHFRGRLDALARFQVVRGVNLLGSYDLEDILRDELHSFEFDQRIEFAGPEVVLNNDTAQLIGLAVHELTTNAIKFGALASADDRTRLKIGWSLADGSLRLAWRETGVSVMAPAPVRTGFGREFIEQALPYQLTATTRFELKPGGLSCTIEIPLGVASVADPSFRSWS
jgi:two-component sensor histidine kinase